jgi:uncharacterized cupredoxin-like copper-binding protein
MGRHRTKQPIRLHRVLGTIVPLSIAAMLLLVGCGGSQPKISSGTGGSVRRVEIALSEFKITPSQTTFQAGRTYQFVVTNRGVAEHEFMTMPAAMGGTHMGTMSMDDMHKVALFHIDAEDLPAGATKTVIYTFPNAAPAGQLEFTCYVPGHYESGMHAPITVTSGS